MLQGWVHSGDLGRQDEDGFFYVCGRMKEILITGFRLIGFLTQPLLGNVTSSGGGENVAPVPIEDDIKAEMSEVVSQAMLVSITFFSLLSLGFKWLMYSGW